MSTGVVQGGARTPAVEDSSSSRPSPRAEAAALLPAPTVEVALDQMALLHALQSASRRVGRETQLDGAELARAERERFQAELRRELREAARAQKKHGKWGKVGKVLGKVARAAAVIGSIAATIASAGTAGPMAAVVIAAIVLSAAGYAVGELPAFDRFPNADKWALGLSLAGAALGCSAGIVGGASAAGQASGGLGRGIQLLGRVAQGTSGAAGVGASVAAVGEAKTAREIAEHQAEADTAAADAEHQRWILQQIIQLLEAMEESESRTSRSLTSAIETRDDTSFQQAAGAQWKA